MPTELNARKIDLSNISAEVHESHARRAAEKEAEIEQSEKSKMLKRLPKEYQSGFDAFQTPTPAHATLLEIVKKSFADYATGDCVFLCLLGSFGVGKTMLSCAFAYEAVTKLSRVFDFGAYRVKTCHSIKYALTSEICEAYERARRFSSAESQTDVVESYYSADIVILDEIGRTKFFDTEKELIYRIINARERAKKTTILCSNLNFQEFGAYVGGAVVDRLKSFGRFPSFTGLESYRGRK